MSIAYTQEYFQQLLEAHEAQKTSAAFLEINDVAINYNTEYEAFEAMANVSNPWSEAWYYDPVRNAAGDVIGMDYVQVPTSVENPPAVINSNATNPVFTKNGGKVRINGSGGGTPPNVFSKGATVLSSQIKAPTLASKLGWAAATVALGTKLGMSIDRLFYESGAGWEFNPDAWKQYVDTTNLDELDKAALRILFGIDDETGDVTPYLNADALGAMYLTLLQSGAFATGETTATYDGQADVGTITQPVTIIPKGQIFQLTSTRYVRSPNADIVITRESDTPTASFNVSPYRTTDDIIVQYSSDLVNWTNYTQSSHQLTTKDSGTTFYYKSVAQPSYSGSAQYLSPYVVYRTKGSALNTWQTDVGTIIFDGTIHKESGLDGVGNDTTGATYFPNPNTITGTDLDTVNQQLRQNYPQLYDGEIAEDVPQPDGTNKHITYIPVPFPNTSDKTKPITGDNHQNNPTSNPTTNTDDQLKDIIDLITQLTTPNLNPNPDIPTDTPTPDTGSGDSPPITVPTGSASSLWAVYNPTQAQVDAFGSWLWSSSFVEQLKKLFNDPMQAIIGIHKVFATPATGATQTIVCGYIDSEVPSKIVTSQYTTIDCGTVNLREYFGNVFDYSPFTEVSLYLPFIGIVKLDVSDVMRASIKVKYHVDVITGACLADVVVTRDNSGGVLYQYSGSAIVTYPISSGSYASAIGGILSIAGGIAATVMTGGAAAPAVLGAAAGISHLHSDVQKSGSFTGAAGAMGSKIPYLIISRPQTGMPSKFAHLQGFPVNFYTKLGSCTGHVRVSDVQVKGVDATDTELDMIRDVLTQGIEI